MAAGLAPPAERRRAARRRTRETAWSPVAVLRPGQPVTIVDVAIGGALVESLARIKPGIRVELQLEGRQKRVVRGHIARSRVIALNPLRYEAAIAFEDPLDSV